MKRILVLSALLAAAAGCRQEMYNQPKYRPLEKSDFFADKRASRPPVEGTVARGSLDAAAGSLPPPGPPGAADLVTALPMPLTRELLARGRQRYERKNCTGAKNPPMAQIARAAIPIKSTGR